MSKSCVFKYDKDISTDIVPVKRIIPRRLILFRITHKARQELCNNKYLKMIRELPHKEIQRMSKKLKKKIVTKYVTRFIDVCIDNYALCQTSMFFKKLRNLRFLHLDETYGWWHKLQGKQLYLRKMLARAYRFKLIVRDDKSIRPIVLTPSLFKVLARAEKIHFEIFHEIDMTSLMMILFLLNNHRSPSKMTRDRCKIKFNLCARSIYS
jgi:hypothetical protein